MPEFTRITDKVTAFQLPEVGNDYSPELSEFIKAIKRTWNLTDDGGLSVQGHPVANRGDYITKDSEGYYQPFTKEYFETRFSAIGRISKLTPCEPIEYSDENVKGSDIRPAPTDYPPMIIENEDGTTETLERAEETDCNNTGCCESTGCC